MKRNQLLSISKGNRKLGGVMNISTSPRKCCPEGTMQDGTETRVPEDAIRCPGNCETCGLCYELPRLGRDVVFHKH